MTAQEIKQKLDEILPYARCELDYGTPFQLLVAVILSAQCTDKRVNIVTKELFEKYGQPQALATADLGEIENIIHSCGFYHNKAINIIEMSKALCSNFGGEVPKTLEELTTLPGVGRKTANVVIGEAFGGDAFAVDTHVLRLSRRLGLSSSDDPLKCEEDLCKFFPKEWWSTLHIKFVNFGRYICKAKNPDCKDCPFLGICTEKNIKE